MTAEAVELAASTVAERVKEQLAGDFPPRAVTWVLNPKITWHGPRNVALQEIDYAQKAGWKATQHPAKLRDFRAKIKSGERKPVILARVPGRRKLMVVDGHHRALASHQLNTPVRAYVALVPSRAGPWDAMHDLQRASGPRTPGAALSRMMELASDAWRHEPRGPHGEWESKGEDDGSFQMKPLDPTRLGQCYALAGRYCMEHRGTLVHGSIQGFGNPRIGHAWVKTPDGKIWEPASNQKWPAQLFQAFFNAQEDQTYPAAEAVAKMVKTGNFGPWGKSSGTTGTAELSRTLELASIDDHHIPGTSYTYRHGWEPIEGLGTSAYGNLKRLAREHTEAHPEGSATEHNDVHWHLEMAKRAERKGNLISASVHVRTAKNVLKKHGAPADVIKTFHAHQTTLYHDHLAKKDEAARGQEQLKARIAKALDHQRQYVPAMVDRTKTVVDNPGTRISADYGGGLIRVNPKIQEQDGERHAGSVQRGFFSQTDTPEDAVHTTIAHEMGHGVASMFGAYMHDTTPKDPIVWETIADALGLPSPQVSTNYGGDRVVEATASKTWLRRNKAAIEKAVSRYGTKDPAELVAELWSEYTTSSHPRPAAKAYGNYVVQHVNATASGTWRSS